MTIQLQLPDATLAALLTHAQAQGRPAEELAAEALSALFAAPQDTERQQRERQDAAAGIEAGLADFAAGRWVALEDLEAERPLLPAEQAA